MYFKILNPWTWGEISSLLISRTKAQNDPEACRRMFNTIFNLQGVKHLYIGEEMKERWTAAAVPYATNSYHS